VMFPAEEFDLFNRQIHRYAALVEDAQEYAEHCQFLVEELRAQVEEETNRNLYTLTMFSVYTARNSDREHLGHECRGHPVQRQLQRFLGGRRADSGDLHLVRDRPLPVQVQVLLSLLAAQPWFISFAVPRMQRSAALALAKRVRRRSPVRRSWTHRRGPLCPPAAAALVLRHAHGRRRR
jgi:hypothetical protein